MVQGLEQVKLALIRALGSQGLQAIAALPPGPAPALSRPIAAVGVRTGESHIDAMGSYLGQRTDPNTQELYEIYGLRSELDLSLDLYAPAEEGASGCDCALEKVHEALLTDLPSGLKATELKWEEPRWDEDTDLFLRRGSLHCMAYFLASRAEDSAVLTDFILKGVVVE